MVAEDLTGSGKESHWASAAITGPGKDGRGFESYNRHSSRRGNKV
jgi:hypothetical protein